MIKNVGKSVRTKLLSISQKENQDYMKILNRFLQERMLYRIANSSYSDKFILKGSALLYAYNTINARPTIDIDLLGNNMGNEPDNLKRIFAEICSIECDDDGVKFDPTTIATSPIAIEKKYPGVTVKVTAMIDTIIQPVSIDIGFGDVVTPHPVMLDYPLLLDDMPAVNIYAYSLETLVAEKFQTMVERDESNSRMKDFFDVYNILMTQHIDSELLKEAIENTFANRNTVYNNHLKLFTDDFANDVARQKSWTTFLKRIKWNEQIPFTEVIKVIKEHLEIYWEAMRSLS